MDGKLKVKVGVDIDGVIWELVEPWLKRFNEMTGDNVKLNDIKTYDVESYIHQGNKDMLYYILEHNDFWETVEPYENMKYWLEKFNNEFDLHIVTATSYKVAHRKFTRFFNLFPFLNEHQVTLTYNKNLMDIDWLIDDYEGNLAKGRFNKILVDQPYNKHFPNEEWKIKRVDNLEQAYEIIKEGINDKI